MKKCARCQEVTYCSRDCQRGDWKVHKVTCRAVHTVTSTGGLRHTEEKGDPSCFLFCFVFLLWINIG